MQVQTLHGAYGDKTVNLERYKMKKSEKTGKELKFRVIGYIPAEPEKQERLTFDNAVKLKNHFQAMQPENIYRIEPEPPSSVITIDVKQFIEDNLVDDIRDMPTDSEIEQFKEQMEDQLHIFITKEWGMFTPEPCAAEMARKERRDMGIMEG